MQLVIRNTSKTMIFLILICTTTISFASFLSPRVFVVINNLPFPVAAYIEADGCVSVTNGHDYVCSDCIFNIAPGDTVSCKTHWGVTNNSIVVDTQNGKNIIPNTDLNGDANRTVFTTLQYTPDNKSVEASVGNPVCSTAYGNSC